jgi:YVTN family beta-propeller protein
LSVLNPFSIKRYIFLLLIFFFSLFTISLVTVISTSNSLSENIVNKNNVVSSKSIHFHGLNFTYPSNLFTISNNNLNMGFSLTNSSPPIINIEYRQNKSDLDSLISSDLEQFNDLKNYSNFTLIGMKKVLISKAPAFQVDFEYQKPNLNSLKKVMHIYTVSNRSIILFSYIEDKDKFLRNLTTANKIFNSSNILVTNVSEKPIPNFNQAKITGMYIDSDTNTIYMTDGSDTVFVVDGLKNTPIKNITVGSRPNDLSSIKNYYLYTVNTGDNSISVIDPDTKRVVKNISINGQSPVGIDVDPNLNDLLVFVTNYDSNSTSIISGDTFKSIKTIPIGAHPYGISVNPFTNRVYIANTDSNLLYVFDYYHSKDGTFVINTNLTKPIQSEKPKYVAVNSLTNTVYVSTPNLVSVINGSSNTYIKNIPINSPGPLTIDKNNNFVYIPSKASPVLHILDGKGFKIIKNITLSTIPLGVSIDQKRNISYVSSKDSNKFYMINSTSLIPLVGIKIQSKNSTLGVSIDCDGKKYVQGDLLLKELNSRVRCSIPLEKDIRFNSWSWLPSEAQNVSGLDTHIDYIPKSYGTLSIDSNKISDAEILSNRVSELLKDVSELLKDEFNKLIFEVIIPVVILAPIVTLIITNIFERRKKRKELKYVNDYVESIKDIYNKHHQNQIECLELLEKKFIDFVELLRKGDISDSTFQTLNTILSQRIIELTKR